MSIRVYQKTWPSGDFSLYREPRPPSPVPLTGGFAIALAGWLAECGDEVDECLWVIRQFLNGWAEFYSLWSICSVAFSSRVFGSLFGLFLLGLSLPIKSHKQAESMPSRDSSPAASLEGSIKGKVSRAARGSGGITPYGGKMVRSACVLIDEEAAGRATGLLTVTLPTDDLELLDLATQGWNEIMRQFMQELEREMKRQGLPQNRWVYVTEWQKRKALHAHIAFIAHPYLAKPKGDEYPIAKDWYRRTWQRILKNVLGVDLDCKSATRIERVKYSLGAYLSKYMSKGDRPGKIEVPTDDSDNGSFRNLNSDELCVDFVISEKHSSTEVEQNVSPSEKAVTHPGAWWGADLELRRAIKKRIEIWERRIGDRVSFRSGIRADNWLWHAENVVKRLDVYWWKFVTAGAGLIAGISGRLRLKNGWKQEALFYFFGNEVNPNLFYKDVGYAEFRRDRDGYFSTQPNPDADIEWYALKMSKLIQVGI